jgi:zinc transport system substrate-binding protein
MDNTINRSYVAILAALLMMTAVAAEVNAALRIGVTLHPYYSWVINLVQDRAEVVPLLPASADPHTYQPQPEDIRQLSELDVIVMNGMGHDDFLRPMLEAAGRSELQRIDLHQDLPLLRLSSSQGIETRTAYNSHTFLSITNAVQQVHNLLDGLIRLDPDNAQSYRNNAKSYKARLRKQLAAALQELNLIDHQDIKIGTVHEGYNYLLQDLGLPVQAVVQPRHGIRPSAKQLADTIQQLNTAAIDILFTEMDYEVRYVDIIQEATGVHLARLSHISTGAYAADTYEKQMAVNLRQIVDAIRAVRQ